MNEQEFNQYFKNIYQQIEMLYQYIYLIPIRQQVVEAMEEITAFLEKLQSLEEQMRNTLEAMEVIEEELLQQNEYLVVESQRYYKLFEFAPNAYLLTTPQGIILEANRAAGSLFNVLPKFLVGRPLANFVHQTERSLFRTQINQLSQVYSSVQEWEILMCPRGGQPFDAILMVKPVHNSLQSLVSLQISVINITKYKQANLPQQPSIVTQLLPLAAAAKEISLSLDGLQVLFVDDEADARQFITALLEEQGVCVTAVATVAEALQVIEQSRPDVIISDIRMPDEDGYALIRKIKALEAEKGWRIPTGAFTGYLTEDSTKAIKAGFQSHLYKLAKPTELIAMVAQLAGRG